MLTVIPIKTAREDGTFDLFGAITAALEKSDSNLQIHLVHWYHIVCHQQL